MGNFPSEKQIPLKPAHLDDNTRNVCELILAGCGFSRFEIAEKIKAFEEQESDQLTLYDAQDIETCEQMKL